MAGQELQQWLADRAGQRAMRRAADGFGEAWQDGPVHRRFERVAAGLSEDPQAAAAAIHALFADDRWIETLIAGLADRLAADPFFDPPFQPLNSDLQTGLLVYEDERLAVAAGIVDAVRLAARKSMAGARSITLSGRITVLKCVRAGGARIAFWEAPEIEAGFTAAGAGRCRRVGARDLADGDILTVDGRRQAYGIERARGNLLLVQAEIAAGRAPLVVEYDAKSGAYLGSSAADDGASRIQMIATLLRKLDCDAAFEPIAAFLDHPDFFVRWHMMKELLGLDGAAALPHLRRMAARDPHGDVRRAARAVLDRIEAAPAAGKAA